jgi:hypothetical protein
MNHSKLLNCIIDNTKLEYLRGNAKIYEYIGAVYLYWRYVPLAMGKNSDCIMRVREHNITEEDTACVHKQAQVKFADQSNVCGCAEVELTKVVWRDQGGLPGRWVKCSAEAVDAETLLRYPADLHQALEPFFVAMHQVSDCLHSSYILYFAIGNNVTNIS